MIYFDNIIFFLQNSGGGSVYWGELIKRFNGLEDVTFIEPSNGTSHNIIKKEIEFRHVKPERNIPLSILRYLPLTIKLDRNSIFHSSYYRYSKSAGVKNIVTVHDFVYERHSQGLKKAIHHWQKKACINNSSGIVCISESTKRDLLHFIPSVAKKKIKVIYNGVADAFKFLSESELRSFKNYNLFKEKKVILYIGHRSPYKNFSFTVKVLESLGNDYHLAIVGAPLNIEEKKLLTSSIPMRYSVFENIATQPLNYIYNLAYCLLYPSSYEGFGIPVLEAFKCRCPVVALNMSSIPEVAQNAALLLDELSVSLFKKAIISLSDNSLRQELSVSGLERSSYFSWDKCFEELNSFYNEFK